MSYYLITWRECGRLAIVHSSWVKTEESGISWCAFPPVGTNLTDERLQRMARQGVAAPSDWIQYRVTIERESGMLVQLFMLRILLFVIRFIALNFINPLAAANNLNIYFCIIFFFYFDIVDSA